MERYIFIGGSGRSGTSYVAKYLSLHSEILGIEDVEIKFIGELNGLVELRNSLVENYTLSRSKNAVKNFTRVFTSLYGNVYEKQSPIDFFLSREEGKVLLDEYLNNVTGGSIDYPKVCTAANFKKNTQLFFKKLYQCGAEKLGFDGAVYLEKTPHNLLNTRFINNLFPGSRFIHVNRDPRSVCWSLKKMNWGPDSLEDCISWYQCYSSAWTAERTRAEYDGIEIFEFRIEDLDVCGDEIKQAMTTFLDLKSPVVFDHFSIENLNKWVSQATGNEIKLMNRLLEKEIHLFGYQDSAIGHSNMMEAVSDECSS